MPKSLLEIAIDKATNENNVVDDWGLIFEIVDQINQSNSEKEAIRLFVKKLNDKDPHVIKHTLTLLNACVTNCERNFKMEVCSRTFIDELRNFVQKKRFPKLSTELAVMIEKWQQENDIKNDPALNLIPTLYNELKKSGVEFKLEPEPSEKNMKIDINLQKKEEEELARAIQLSLKETSGSSSISKTKTPNNSASSLFGSLSQSTQKISQTYANKSEKRKIKALYDFEAAEDNEITFKAGDILFLTDDSDQNWWKGIDSNGVEGLFPSNFVTFDLNEKLDNFENFSSSSNKKVSFNDNVNVNLIENIHHQAPRQIVIDEKKIDKCIEMLQNADPTGEIQPDTQELIDLEEECYMMGPLIDKKLQFIDQKHTQLEDLNIKLLEAFQTYNNLMKESITKTSTLINSASSMMAMNPGLTNQPNYLAAPPSLDQSSILLANQLNSLALNTAPNMMLPPGSNLSQGVPVTANAPASAPIQAQTQYVPPQQQIPPVTGSNVQAPMPSAYSTTNSLQSLPAMPAMASFPQIYSNGLPSMPVPSQNYLPNTNTYPAQY